MYATDPKVVFHRYLRAAREALLWKLEGLSEYDVRRPLTPTGTNLLGLVKHLTGCEAGYFGDTFGKPFAEPLYWLTPDAETNIDMWAAPDEFRADIIGRYQRACTHADAIIDTLELHSSGVVPHWPSRQAAVTLQDIFIHMLAETHRHAGHADIVRELIDGAVGMRPGNDNLPRVEAAWWRQYHDKLEQAARQADETGARDG